MPRRRLAGPLRSSRTWVWVPDAAPRWQRAARLLVELAEAAPADDHTNTGESDEPDGGSLRARVNGAA